MDEVLLVSPIQFRVLVGTVPNPTQVRLHGRYHVRLRLPGARRTPSKPSRSFTHYFDITKEGDASGIMEGIGSSLQYVSITSSVFGSV